MKKTAFALWAALSLFTLAPQVHAATEDAACETALESRLSPGLAAVLEGDGRRSATAYFLIDVTPPAGFPGEFETHVAQVLTAARAQAQALGLNASIRRTLWHADEFGVAFVEVSGTVARLRTLVEEQPPYFATALWAGLNHSSTIAEHHRTLVQGTAPEAVAALRAGPANPPVQEWLDQETEDNAAEARRVSFTLKRGVNHGDIREALDRILGVDTYTMIRSRRATLVRGSATRSQVREIAALEGVSHISFAPGGFVRPAAVRAVATSKTPPGHGRHHKARIALTRWFHAHDIGCTVKVSYASGPDALHANCVKEDESWPSEMNGLPIIYQDSSESRSPRLPSPPRVGR